MLAGASFSDDPALFHPSSQKRLAQGVVYLVGPAVV
jgi:hypothetical protein